jgi:uncharacterized MAPEG superfamily protein
MKPEIFWLTATLVLTALLWVPYVLDRLAVRGLPATVAGGGPAGGPHSPWAQRLIHAHHNAVENLAIFAPLVLIAQLQGLSSPLLAGAAQVYFFARLAHAVVYGFALPVLRTLAFTAGFVAQMIFVAAIFKLV